MRAGTTEPNACFYFEIDRGNYHLTLNLCTGVRLFCLTEGDRDHHAFFNDVSTVVPR